MSSEKRTIEKEKLALIYERNKERALIVKQLKNHGPSTIPELSKATEMPTDKVLRHIVAMKQFGKVTVVGEKDDQLIWDLSEK